MVTLLLHSKMFPLLFDTSLPCFPYNLFIPSKNFVPVKDEKDCILTNKTDNLYFVEISLRCENSMITGLLEENIDKHIYS